MAKYLIKITYASDYFKNASFLLGKDNKVHNFDYDCNPMVLYSLEEATEFCKQSVMKDKKDGYNCITYEPYELSEKRIQSQYVKYSMI